MEFGIVTMPLLLLVLGVMEFTFDLYVQSMLDYAVHTSARLIATGAIQGTANSLATFEQVAFCPIVSGLLPCSAIYINVVPVPTFFSDTPAQLPMKNGVFDPSGFAYCPGQPEQLVEAQAVYPVPSFAAQLFPAGITQFGGNGVRLISSTAGFVNEPYTSTVSPPPGC